MAPPLSITGVWQSLRVPTARDWSFSFKAWLAVAISLLIGFSQDLENPYWSALTVYIVLMQPESGAIRSKALFRLIGTVAGGLIVMALTALFADHLGYLLSVDIAVIVLSTWARQIDRTPTNYIWFSAGLTAGFIGLVDLQTPIAIFGYATARMAEILIGILVMAMVDSVIWPRAMLPDFVDTLEDWRCQARDWVVDALGRTERAPPDEERRAEVRDRLRKLTETVGTIDQRAVQLPYDIVDAPPRKRDLNLLRATLQRLIADLASIETWTRAMRRVEGPRAPLEDLLRDISDWVRDDDQTGDHARAYATRSDALDLRIGALTRDLAVRTDDRALIERGILLRLSAFVQNWADFAVVVRSVATRAALPPRLRAMAKDAVPVRSIDYLANALDVAPMALALTIAAVIYYLSAWDSGPTAMLFAFIGCAFLIGQPSTLRSAAGVFTWVGIAFALVFAYQFAILPRVTQFPVLMIVIAFAMIPVGLVLAVSLAGLFIAVFFFAFLGIQNVYNASFEMSLLQLGGGMSGLLIATISLYVLGYDKPHFAGWRLVAALRRDIADAASVRRAPGRDRFLFLTIDRLGLFFPLTEQIADEDDPLKRIDMIDDLRIGLNILFLREREDELPADVRGEIDRLLARIAAMFRTRAADMTLPDDLDTELDRLIEDTAHADPHAAHRDRLLAALVGLRLALSRDASPFATGVAGVHPAAQKEETQ